MQPTISFHDVARVEFEPTQEYTRDGGGTFAARRLWLTDKLGHRFMLGLFAETVDALQIHEQSDADVAGDPRS